MFGNTILAKQNKYNAVLCGLELNRIPSSATNLNLAIQCQQRLLFYAINLRRLSRVHAYISRDNEAILTCYGGNLNVFSDGGGMGSTKIWHPRRQMCRVTKFSGLYVFQLNRASHEPSAGPFTCCAMSKAPGHRTDFYWGWDF